MTCADCGGAHPAWRRCPPTPEYEEEEYLPEPQWVQAEILEDGSVRIPSGELRLREGDQPLPVPNGELDVQSQVIADIEARRQVGISRYGTALQPFNGRDALRDLYEELLDACCYIKQVLIERGGADGPPP